MQPMDGNSPSDFVAAIAVFGIFVMPILGWVIVRYLRHVEHLAMIRAGMQPPIKGVRDWRTVPPPQNMPGMPIPPTPPYTGRRRGCEPDFSAVGQQIALQKGIKLTFIGMALTLGLGSIGFLDGPVWHPGPWLLGGLIPLFIGLAQVAGAVVGGATFGPAFDRRPQPGPAFNEQPFTAPSSAPPPYGATPTYDSSYTYRPGDTTELRPPPMPPDRR
jgi:hypothetical protein